MSALVAMLIALGAAPLEEGREAYQSGRLDDARGALQALLYPLQLDDPALEREARLLLSATHFAKGETQRAEEEAIRALGLAPSDPVDPLLFPPDFVAFARDVQARHGARIAALAAERRTEPDSPVQTPVPPAAPSLTPPVEPTRIGVGWAFVPLGAPQLRQGRTVPGAVLATTQGVCLATAVTGLAGALSLRGEDGLYARTDAPTARVLNTAYVAGAWCFLGVYAYGAIDALVHR